jgi:hypothetical protein
VRHRYRRWQPPEAPLFPPSETPLFLPPGSPLFPPPQLRFLPLETLPSLLLETPLFLWRGVKLFLTQGAPPFLSQEAPPFPPRPAAPMCGGSSNPERNCRRPVDDDNLCRLDGRRWRQESHTRAKKRTKSGRLALRAPRPVMKKASRNLPAQGAAAAGLLVPFDSRV